MDHSRRKKPLQFVFDMMELGTAELVAAFGVDADSAREVMREIAHRICQLHGRSTMYIPADLEFELTKRDKEIWREYGQDSATALKHTPARVAELAEKYRLTTVHVYNVTVRMQKAELKARQTKLPGFEEAA